MKKLIIFFKKETVLSVAWILAILSMFLIPPSTSYIEYIDLKSLGILWSLMVIMAGLKGIGFFDKVGQKLLKQAHTSHQLTLILVYLCFFSSMLITNDVALITFVPFAIFMLEICEREDLLIPVITMQTLATNLGSMLTPIGNPQNLYLYGLSQMALGDFVLLLLPYACITFFLLLISSFLIKDRKRAISENVKIKNETLPKSKLMVYGLLFVLALLVVSKLVPYYYLVLAVLILVFLLDRHVLVHVDYALLFTFVGFFIFTGNLGKLPAVNSALTSLVAGREVLTGVLASQIISNVPAALLLSTFTENYRELILGVNFGGLGTLIASMASLISFKELGRSYGDKRGRYLVYFTGMNIVYLVILMAAYFILQ